MNIITNLCIFWDNIVNITIEFSSKSIVSLHGSMCNTWGAFKFVTKCRAAAVARFENHSVVHS